MPVGSLKLESFYPLYIIEAPEGEDNKCILRPVGQLSDLDVWLSSWRFSGMTKTAVVLLFLGFMLQLAGTLLRFYSDSSATMIHV